MAKAKDAPAEAAAKSSMTLEQALSLKPLE